MSEFTHEAASPVPPAKSYRWLWWVLGLSTLFGVVICGGVISWLAYIGMMGPETSVYTGNSVPRRFVTTMQEVGALDEDEEIFYFYSDALTDIRDGFYFVSDKKLVIYNEAVGGEPLTAITFDQIADISINKSDSFWIDSEIFIELDDGRPVSFPVSSEGGKDQMFFDAIVEGMGMAP